MSEEPDDVSTRVEPAARGPREPEPMGQDDRTRADLGAQLGSDEQVDVRALENDSSASRGGPRYRPEGVLGKGGMGEVQLCVDTRIGRRIALKRMLPADKEVRALRTRFLREGRVQGQLEHPAIVPVYDMGRDEDGRDFFTMKRVRGESLDRILRRFRDGDAGAAREHTRHRLLAAFSQVCLAVHYAHERGVVHRDLKPANIMLGGFGEVYVLDWGLGKLLSDEEPSGRDVEDAIQLDDTSSGSTTEHGAILGTLAYAAPEQLRSQRTDARADVWALGAILFELLTLERLIPRAEPREMFETSTTGAYDVRPSARAPQAQVPPELEAICIRATAFDPAERYATARALEADIQQFLAGDRDMALRRSLAASHVAAAKERSGAEATEELGRALALDPQNADALAMLLEILTRPPAETPPEVLAEADAEAEAGARRVLGLSGWLVAVPPLVVFVPLTMLMGVRSPTLIALCVLPYLLTGAFGVAWSKRRRDAWTGARLMAYATAVCVAAASVLLGPFVFVPALATMCSGFAAFFARRISVLHLVGAQSLAVLVPAALERAGLLPRIHAFLDDGSLRITSPGVRLPELPTMALLVTSSVFCILVAGVVVSMLATRLQRAELARLTQAWQIRHLLPRAAQHATTRLTR